MIRMTQEEFIPNAPDEMEYMTCTQRRLDGGDNRSVNTDNELPHVCDCVQGGAGGS